MMIMTREQMMNELGLTGEKVIINMLSELGCKIQSSVNKFDNRKDLLVDDKYTVEVKTQAPFFKLNSFTFTPSQLNKCQSVDVLYFISVPHPKFKHFSDGWIYRVEPKKFTFRRWTDKKGIPRILVPIEQDALMPVKQISQEEMRELQKYITTDYK
jgi:hypothetical protein